MTHYALYKTQERATVLDIVRQFPFAAIIRNEPEGDFSSVVQVPVLVGDQDVLEFHIAKANPAFSAFASGGPLSLLFNGPNGYVSPSWYKERFKSGDRSQTAPTWDYVGARIDARATAIPANELRGHLGRLVKHFEGAVGDRWGMEEADPVFLERLSGHIQGFRAAIVFAEATRKLSQEQSAADRAHVIEALTRSGGFQAGALALSISETLRPDFLPE